ncbi:MAG: NHL repeat-containing protein [Cytophaga sp.]|uniref:NHL repeat-containing protein n=1 Tax=Cytophaga sp. TaxID=29535 RepID=UPI003F81751A
MRIFTYIFTLPVLFLLLNACERPEVNKPLPYGVPFPCQSSAVVTTITGRNCVDNRGNVDGNLTTACYGQLEGLAFDSKNNLFVVDKMFHTIRKITPSGEVSTFAGSGKAGHTDANGTNASFYMPVGIAIDPDDNLYVADCYNNCIRKITPAGDVITFAGSINGTEGHVNGTGTSAQFSYPLYLVLDAESNLYVTEGHKIRKITPEGEVTTLAGQFYNGDQDGPGTKASFWTPSGIAIGPDKNIYIVDSGGMKIRKITPDGFVTTFAGVSGPQPVDGNSTTAVFLIPQAITIDASGNLFITEYNLIRKVSPDSVVTTIAGGNGSPYIEDGIGCECSFKDPQGITIDTDGNLYVTQESMIRKITLK